jgi:hypothetical protein
MLQEFLQHLQGVLINEYSQSKGMFGELARMETNLADTYRNRIQYELLQNSDDAASTEVHITISSDGKVVWTNNGEPFSNSNAQALCRSASTSKKRGDAIGYRGIGFKSLAAVARHIEVRSAGTSFCFDRADATALLSAGEGEVAPAEIPLIRIPSRISACDTTAGASFVITPINTSTTILGDIDPLALLFLRHVQSLTLKRDGATEVLSVARDDDRTCVHFNDDEARFAILKASNTSIALPLDEPALSLCTLRGRLACFLPLEDSLGLPLAVSGDILTDPSRTHAVVADDSTQLCLREAAQLFGSQLADPRQPYFQRAWELLLIAEDPRSLLMSDPNSADRLFFESLRDYLRNADLPFAFAPITIAEEDLPKIFPAGAPKALYRHGSFDSVRALRAALGLRWMDVATRIRPVAEELTSETLSLAREYIIDQLKALGRRPSEEEKYLVGYQHPELATPEPPPPTLSSDQGADFGEVVAKWEIAEQAVLSWLNSRGWDLKDVSKQNLGYDLLGISPDGERTMIEVKRVQRPNARFAMTNNEMGAVESEEGCYLLAIAIGEGRYSRLMLLDPHNKAVPRERVCRAWEWQFSEWERHGDYLN